MTDQKLRFGVLGCASIAVNRVIPAIQQSQTAVVTAIASRDVVKAQETAARLSIPRSYGTYESLIEGPEIDAVYVPLPNQ